MQFIKKFWGQLEIPDLESRDTGEVIDEDDKISKIDRLIKFCLSFDPNDSKFRKVRSRALSVLFKIHFLSSTSTENSKSTMKTLVLNLISDQDKHIRLKVIQKITRHYSVASNKPKQQINGLESI